jgi:hypothetical protein
VLHVCGCNGEGFQTLMLCRFFAGVFASCPLAVVGGAFSDLFGNETRGIAIAGFSALVFIGPFISPIVGAFITQWVRSHSFWIYYCWRKRTRKPYCRRGQQISGKRQGISQSTMFLKRKSLPLRIWSRSTCSPTQAPFP